MDNEMLALYKEANRKWNEKEHLMRNVLRYKDAPRASIGESDRRSLFAVGLTDDLMDWKIVSLDFGSSSSYYAYICNEDTAIGAHYRLVGELTSEIRIFDDVPSPYWPEVQSQLYKPYFAFKSFNALRESIALPS